MDETASEPLVLVKSPYWAALSGFLVLFLAFVAYLFFGTIPVRVQGSGKLAAPTTVEGRLPPSSSGRVRPGMPVEVTFSVADPARYGRALGEVSLLFHDHLTIALYTDTRTASGFQWTQQEGPPFAIPMETPCEFQVRVESKQPISFLLP